MLQIQNFSGFAQREDGKCLSRSTTRLYGSRCPHKPAKTGPSTSINTQANKNGRVSCACERTFARAGLCKQTGVNIRGLLPIQHAHAESHCLFCAKLEPTHTHSSVQTAAKAKSGGQSGSKLLLGMLLLLATTYPY